jgi:hypothetical protein
MRTLSIILFVATLMVGWLDNLEAQIPFCIANVGASCDSTVDHPCCIDNTHAAFCQNSAWQQYECQIQFFSPDGTHAGCEI